MSKKVFLISEGRIFGMEELHSVEELRIQAKELKLSIYDILPEEMAIQHLYNWTQDQIEDGKLHLIAKLKKDPVPQEVLDSLAKEAIQEFPDKVIYGVRHIWYGARSRGFECSLILAKQAYYSERNGK